MPCDAASKRTPMPLRAGNRPWPSHRESLEGNRAWLPGSPALIDSADQDMTPRRQVVLINLVNRLMPTARLEGLMADIDARPVTVTLAEIARIAGVGRAAVSNWRRRYPTFPKPVGGTDASPTFSLETVEAWLREHKGSKVRPGALERLWPRFEADGDRNAMGRTVASVGAVLSGRATVATAKKELSAAERMLLDETLTVAQKEGPRETFNFLLDRWLGTHVRQITTTPAALGELMCHMAETFAPEPVRTVLDPACGTGSLLLAAADRWAGEAPLRLAGQEMDPVLAAVALARLAMAEESPGARRETSRAGNAFDIKTGDTLRADAHGGIEADVVLCNPPTNERDWGHGELATDPRWAFGHPSRTESELAWVQHVISALSPAGVAVVVLPPAVAARRAGRRIRAALLRSGALRAVVALPPGAAPPYGIGLHLWMLRRPSGDAPPNTLLMVDTADCRSTFSTGRPAVDWQRVRERVSTALLDERTEACVRIPVIDLLNDQVDITPARHVPSSDATTTLRLRRTWTDFGTRLSGVSDLVGTLSALAPMAEPAETSAVTVEDLERSGAVQIRSARPLPQGLLRHGDRPADAVAALTLNDLLLGEATASWISAADSREHHSELTMSLPGDVIVVCAARAFDVWVETGDPTALGPQLQLIRANNAVIDPWFLAACLSSSENARQAGGHASTSSRIDVRRLRVLRLPLDEQRRYGEIFRTVVAFEEGVRALSAEGEQLRRTLIELLAAGRLPRD